MPTATYTPLATVTLGSSASSITFSNIPATYRDLIISVDGLMASGGGFSLRVNGDTGNNYPQMMMRGEASATSSADPSSGQLFYGSWSTVETSQRYQALWHFLDYSTTNKQKIGLLRNRYQTASAASTESHTVRWSNTAAITSLQFVSGSGTFASSTRIDLYGVIA
jgi:hypothetical protein